MEAFTKWAQKPETKAKLAAAKTNAWADFTKQFPNADKTKFVAQNNVDDKWNITAEVFFKEGSGSLQSVFGSDRKYWSQQMKTEFLTLIEDAIRQPDLAKSVKRYQLAVDEAKVRLNLVVCPGAWLMPARMIINTESAVGYNNKLKQAVPGMKLGVNNDVNPGTKKAGIKNMEGGQSKINPPNSHPSNPIHKEATAAQDPKPQKRVRFNLPSDEAGEIEEELKDETPQHEINKTAVIIGVVVVAALLMR